MLVRELIITPVLNGFLVHAGCQKVVFTSLPALTAAIASYYTDPIKTESEFLKTAVNKMQPPPQPEVACGTQGRNDSVVRFGPR